MSELTTCNYCSLKYRRAEAKEVGSKVTLRASKHGGYDVFEHPSTVTIPKDYQHEDDKVGGPSQYWRAWYMALSDKCCC